MKISKIAYISLLIGSSILYAETDTLEELTVSTGSYVPEAISEIPNTVYYISNEQLKKQINGGKTLGATLGRLIPGFDTSSEGKTNYGQNLRGRTALIMIDGVSLNSSRSVSRQLDSIDPNNIDHIEVISGASALYAGATGGAINIITKKGSYDTFSGSIYMGAKSGFNKGDDKDKNLGFSFTTSTDDFSNKFSFNSSETNAFYDGDDKLVLPDIVQGSNTFNKTIDVSNTLSVDLTDTQRLNFTAQYYSSKQESDYGLDLGQNYSAITSEPNLSKEYESDNNPETNRRFFNLDYINEDFLGQTLYSQLSYRKENFEFNPFMGFSDSLVGGSLPYFTASTQDTDYLSYKLALSKEFNKNFKATYGFDVSRDELNSYQTIFDPYIDLASNGLTHKSFTTIGKYPKTVVKSYAAFAQFNYLPIDDLNISAGIRHQYTNNRIGDFAQVKEQASVAFGGADSAEQIKGEEASYNVTLYNLGVTYNLDTKNKIWANYSEGFDLPDPAKYYGRGTYKLENNRYVLVESNNISELDGIKTDSYELGYSYSEKNLNFQTSLYYSKSDKNIDYVSAESSYSIFDEDMRIYGIEGLINTTLNNNIYLGANFNFLKTEIKKDGHYEKASIFQASNSKVGYFVGYKNKIMDISLNANTMFSLKDDDNNKIKSYTLVDIFSSYNVANNHTINLGVENIFNTTYTTVWGERAKIAYGSSIGNTDLFDFKGRGRTFSLKYTYTF